MREVDYASVGSALSTPFNAGPNNERHSLYELVISMCGQEYDKTFKLPYSPIIYRRKHDDTNAFPEGIVLIGPNENTEQNSTRNVMMDSSWTTGSLILEHETVTVRDYSVGDIGTGTNIQTTSRTTEIPLGTKTIKVADYLGEMTQHFFDNYKGWTPKKRLWVPPSPEVQEPADGS